MKTILFTATALSLTGAALANGNEWSALDREVEALASSLVDNHDGIHISAYADIWYRNQAGGGAFSATTNDGGTPADATDDYIDGFDSADLSAFGVNNARLMLSGGSGGFGAYIEYQMASGVQSYINDGEVGSADDPATAENEFDAGSAPTGATNDVSSGLLDAYVTQDLGGMKLTMGRFKVVGNASAMQHERDMFFATRSNIGYHYASRDEGVQLSGGDGFNWSIGIADGTDGDGDEYRMSAHGDMELGGGLTAGVTYTSATDDTGADGDAIIVDLAYSMDALTLAAEIGSIGDGAAATGNGDGSVFGYSVVGYAKDDSPFAVCAHYELGGESAIGVRYQDAGNDNGDTQIDVAYNYANWNIQYSTFDNDGEAADDLIVVGLQVGF